MVMKKGGERERVSEWGAFSLGVPRGVNYPRHEPARSQLKSTCTVSLGLRAGAGQVPWRLETPRDYCINGQWRHVRTPSRLPG